MSKQQAAHTSGGQRLDGAGGDAVAADAEFAQFRKKGLIVKTGANQYDRGDVARLQGPAVLALTMASAFAVVRAQQRGEEERDRVIAQVGRDVRDAQPRSPASQ